MRQEKILPCSKSIRAMCKYFSKNQRELVNIPSSYLLKVDSVYLRTIINTNDFENLTQTRVCANIQTL